MLGGCSTLGTTPQRDTTQRSRDEEAKVSQPLLCFSLCLHTLHIHVVKHARRRTLNSHLDAYLSSQTQIIFSLANIDIAFDERKG